MQTLNYNIVLQPEKEGGFTVIVPSLPGCISYGKTISEAKKMATDAIGAYLASIKKHREPIPSDNESFIASVQVRTKTPSR